MAPKPRSVKKAIEPTDASEDAAVVAKVQETPQNVEVDNAQEGAEEASEDSEQGSEDPEESSESEASEAKDEAVEDLKKEPEEEKKAEEDSKKETEEGKKVDEDSKKETEEGKKEAKPKRKRVRRPKQKKAGAKLAVVAAEAAKDKKLAGLIFMCKSSTKDDCFQYKVFGLPQSKKDLVERIRPNMKLFLYDSDERLMHGIYLATSTGGMNLEPRAFSKSGASGFPAQVKFRIQKECSPLAEDAFKPAIKDNYYDKKRFNFELDANQVKSLSQLFRPAPRGGGKVQQQQRPQSTVRNYDRRGRSGYEANGSLDVRARREIPYGAGYRGVPDYLPPKVAPFVDPLLSRADLRRLEYARDAPLPVDPYQDAYLPYRRPLPRGLPEGLDVGQTDPELDLLYRQRLQMYSDPLLDRGLALDPLASSVPIRKRAYDEAFLDERALLLGKRQMHDEMLYRGMDYQRAAPSYLDEHLAARYYTGI